MTEDDRLEMLCGTIEQVAEELGLIADFLERIDKTLTVYVEEKIKN